MKPYEESEARRLRQQGKSLKEIARLLRISLSTASRWCVDISLSEKQRATLDEKRRAAGMEALKPYIERNRMRKEADVALQNRKGKKDVGTPSERDIFMLGLGLYWGEGYKRGSQEWGLTNSDPLIIRTVLKWMSRFYAVEKDRFHASLTINRLYADRADFLMEYWSNETTIPLSQFARPTFIDGYGNPDRDPKTYRGTLRLKIRNSTSLRRRVLASIAAFGNQIS